MKILASDREVDAYLHRTRMMILDTLQDRPGTVSHIAERLGVHPANLTRHMRILERAELIRRVEGPDDQDPREKFYAPVARAFEVQLDADAARAPQRTALTMARSDLSASLARLDDEDPGLVFAAVAPGQLSEPDAAAFAQELAELVKKFAARRDADGEVFHLNVSLYPRNFPAGGGRPVALRRTPKKES